MPASLWRPRHDSRPTVAHVHHDLRSAALQAAANLRLSVTMASSAPMSSSCSKTTVSCLHGVSSEWCKDHSWGDSQCGRVHSSCNRAPHTVSHEQCSVFGEEGHLEKDSGSEGVVVPRDRLSDVQVPGGALIAHTLDHLAPVGVCVECVLAGHIALIPHLLSSMLSTYHWLQSKMHQLCLHERCVEGQALWLDA